MTPADRLAEAARTHASHGPGDCGKALHVALAAWDADRPRREAAQAIVEAAKEHMAHWGSWDEMPSLTEAESFHALDAAVRRYRNLSTTPTP